MRNAQYKATRSRSALILAWIALMLGAGALGLGWAAYNRSGEDLETQIDAQLTEAKQDMQQRYSYAEARLRLMAIRTELAAEQNYDQAVAETKEVRSDLAFTFSEAADASQSVWRPIDQGLERLISELEGGSQEALQQMDAIADQLQDAQTSV